MKTGIYWQDPKYALRPGRDFIFDPSLVLYLPLHQLDGASFMSKDAYGHLATVTGALWTPNGRSFDGIDDKVDCGNATSLIIEGSFSLEVWFKASGSVGAWKGLIGKIVGGTHNRLFQYNTNQHLGFEIYDGTNDVIASTGVAIDDDVWHHAVAVRDTVADKAIIYLDSVLKQQVTDTTTASITGANNFLVSENGWGGLVGEVRIYNRVLTPLEIQRNYLATKWRYQ